MRKELVSLTRRIINRSLLAIRVVTLAVCFFTAFGGHYPPVFAQIVRTQPGPSTEDSLQDDHIAAINEHLKSTDANIEVLKKASEQTANDLSAYRGGVATALTIIGLLAGGGIVLQFKQKQV